MSLPNFSLIKKKQKASKVWINWMIGFNTKIHLYNNDAQEKCKTKFESDLMRLPPGEESTDLFSGWINPE